MFKILVVTAAVSALASLVALELSVARLPPDLAAAHRRRKEQLVAISDRMPWITWGGRLILLGYFVSLAMLGLDVMWAKHILLACSLGWTALGVLNAPNIQHWIGVPFYEVSLLVNGAVLALAYSV